MKRDKDCRVRDRKWRARAAALAKTCRAWAPASVESDNKYVFLRTRTYGFLPAIDRSVDYGEFPARAGEIGDTFVTFATVKDEKTGYPSKVIVRTFVPSTGQEKKEEG